MASAVCYLARLVIMLRIKKWITGWNSKHELLPLEAAYWKIEAERNAVEQQTSYFQFEFLVHTQLFFWLSKLLLMWVDTIDWHFVESEFSNVFNDYLQSVFDFVSKFWIEYESIFKRELKLLALLHFCIFFLLFLFRDLVKFFWHNPRVSKLLDLQNY